MKRGLPTGVCVLIALALVAFGVLYGTWMGFADDQADVAALLESENGLMDVLDYRAADGLNLCVVARRHLMGDADVAALEAAARKLQSAAALDERRGADAQLMQAVETVKARLLAQESFQQSQRDQRYLDMLTADLTRLGASAAVSTYNQAAQAFNDQLGKPLFGALVRLMGMQPCPVYE